MDFFWQSNRLKSTAIYTLFNWFDSHQNSFSSADFIAYTQFTRTDKNGLGSILVWKKYVD